MTCSGPAGDGSIAAAVAAGFGDDASRPAVIGADGTWSWRAVAGSAVELAASTSAVGGPVGILETSGTELLTVMLAAAIHGRPACALHHDWSGAELAAGLCEAGIREVFTRRRALPGDVKVRRPPAIAEPGPMTLDAAAFAGDVGDAPFYVGFTSGSSGRPKPFVRRQRSWAASFEIAAETFGVSREAEVVLPGHLQHSHFLFGALLGWSQGAPLRLSERFEPHGLAEDLRVAREVVLYAVPTMIEALDRAGAAAMAGVRSVVVSGAKMEPHHWAAAARLWPRARVAELYGASETSFITVNRCGPDERDPGLVGVPFPGVEIDIRPREHDVPGHGLVHVRSPFLFDGYLRAGTLSPAAAEDGFITVGDVGTLRPDGALSLRGRASNLVITGGRNVHPEEIEAALATHEHVAECVVVGVPHAYWGEELVAYVVPSAAAAPGGHELRSFLRARLAGYKVPKRWVTVEALPRTSSGKTDRRRVRELACGPATR